MIRGPEWPALILVKGRLGALPRPAQGGNVAGAEHPDAGFVSCAREPARSW
jgi:hypothetical protein